MEIRQLEYFVATAETLSFSKGAQRCHVAQPSLSQQIKKLEDRLQKRLFDRLGRRIALTEAGAALLPRAQEILAAVRGIRPGLEEDLEAGRGRLVVGALPTIAPYLLPPLVRRFRKGRPDAEIAIREDYTEGLVRAVVDAEVDIGLASLPIDDPRVKTETLFWEPLQLVVPRDHPLAGARRVRMQDLREERAVVIDQVHCLGEQIRSFCHARRVLDRVVCETTQLATVLSLVGLGIGISLVPAMCAAADRGRERTYVGLGPRGPRRAITAITHPARAQRRLTREFLELARGVNR